MRVQTRSRLLFALALLSAFAVVPALKPAPAAAQTNQPVTRTTIRFVNAVPDTPPLAVKVDDRTMVEGIEFGAASDFVSIEPGERTIEALADGRGVATGNPNIDEGSAYIITFLGQIGDIGVKVNEVKLSALDPGKARVRAIHVSPDAGDLTVSTTAGDELFSGVAYEEDTEYKQIDAGSYDLTISGADDAELAQFTLDASSGTSIDVIALGVVGAGSFAILPIVTNVSPPCSELLGVGTVDEACVRIVNGYAALGDADAAIGGSMLVAALPVGQATEFIPVRASDKLIFTMVPTGMTDTEDEPRTISLKAGQAYLIVAWAALDNATVAPTEIMQQTRVEVYEVNLTPLPNDQGRIRLINAAADDNDLDVAMPELGNDASLFEGVARGKSTEYEVLDAGTYPFEIHYAGEEAALFEADVTLQAGVVYDVVAIGSAADKSFLLVVLTAPSDARDGAATPVPFAPGATPEPMAT